MTKADLTLVPVEDLVEELTKRHSALIMCGTRFIDGGPACVYSTSKAVTFTESLGLCALLKEHILQKYYEANNSDE